MGHAWALLIQGWYRLMLHVWWNVQNASGKSTSATAATVPCASLVPMIIKVVVLAYFVETEGDVCYSHWVHVVCIS